MQCIPPPCAGDARGRSTLHEFPFKISTIQYSRQNAMGPVWCLIWSQSIDMPLGTHVRCFLDQVMWSGETHRKCGKHAGKFFYLVHILSSSPTLLLMLPWLLPLSDDIRASFSSHPEWAADQWLFRNPPGLCTRQELQRHPTSWLSSYGVLGLLYDESHCLTIYTVSYRPT